MQVLDTSGYTVTPLESIEGVVLRRDVEYAPVSAAFEKLFASVADLNNSIADCMADLKAALNDPLMIRKARNFERYTRRYQRGKR